MRILSNGAVGVGGAVRPVLFEMIIQKGSIAFDALCLWDLHDNPILDFLWANLDTKVASVSTATMTVHRRVEIGRFAFMVYSVEQMQALTKTLPEELHQYILFR